jgi:Mrp family chromosome partitioning ATPase
MTVPAANNDIVAASIQPLQEQQTETAAAVAEAVPSNANTGCVGPTAESAGKVSSCEGCPNQSACSSGAFSSPEALEKAAAEVQALKESLHNVSNVILVISGKGGVGKSTVAAQLAHTLAAQNYAVGVLGTTARSP